MGKVLLQYIITFLILYFGNLIVPEYIHIDSHKTTLIATTILTFVEFIFAFIVAFIMTAVSKLPFYKICKYAQLVSIVIIFLGIITFPVSLFITSKYLVGFSIHGILTYIVLSIIILTLRVSNKK